MTVEQHGDRTHFKAFSYRKLMSLYCGGLLAVIVAVFAYPTIKEARQRFDGFVLVAEPPIQDVEFNGNTEHVQARFTIKNLTNEAVTLYGVSTDCTCVTVTDLPMTFAPREARQIGLEVHHKCDNAGIVVLRKASLLIDKPSPRYELQMRVGCHL